MKERIMAYEMKDLNKVLDKLAEDEFISVDEDINDIYVRTHEYYYKRKSFSFEQRHEENEQCYTFTGSIIKNNYIFVNIDDCEDIILYNKKLNRVIY